MSPLIPRGLSVLLPVAVVLLAFATCDLRAQTPPRPSSTTVQEQAPVKAAGSVKICDLDAQPPANLPPSGSPPIFWMVVPCFEEQGGHSLIDARTYVYYIQTLENVSRPSENRWTPWSEQIEQSLIGDFRRLWNTNFLDNLTVDVQDYEFSNGVVGKVALFRMEEKERVKIVDYEGTEALNRTDIDEKLREAGTVIRLDTFLSEADIRRVEGVIRSMLAEKGHLDAKVTHAIKPLPSGPKLVHLTFNIEDGPEVKISRITFLGNEAVSDRTLRGKMEHNKQPGFFRFVGIGVGTYKEEQFEEDAQEIISYYREEGYLKATVGQPEIRSLSASKDGDKRVIELRIPITEGRRYHVGEIRFAAAKVVKQEALRPLFALEKGDYYNEKKVRDGIEKAHELYGSGGYFEFTGYPEFSFKDTKDPNAAPVASNTDASKPAEVDVTMHMQEGEQYFVNRITFTGNTTTKDHVIRREMGLLESGVFNTEALKYSIRRINQLGYFRPLGESETQEDIQVEKTPHETNKVDITLNLDERNRNEFTFGAGMSGIDGLFVNASFATTNFLGQGETLQVSVQTGERANNYQVSASEPYLFGRPIRAGITLFSRKYDLYVSPSVVGYSEARSGMTVMGGLRAGPFSQAFTTYTYEVIDTATDDDLSDGGDDGSDDIGDDGGSDDAGVPVFDPFLDDGRHIESRLSPSFVYNTVDNPFLPRRGMKLTGTFEVAGGPLGGTVDYIRPEAEAVLYIPHTQRTALGLRGQIGYVRPFSDTNELPYYRRFFLGGETQIRGVDFRSVGPLGAANRLLGGNKFLLFNAEYYFDIAGPVRALAFHDAGQAFDEGQPFDLRQLRTSSGAELRFIVPMMNVPFRLIYAWNIYRDTFQPERTFRFAVGTTF
ncbi:MAG: outer membrane protein assembly factor BamA [Luteitalea sp.]|nr:outer membrane protein assembly factor BamA [Luteitalea sp.]